MSFSRPTNYSTLHEETTTMEALQDVEQSESLEELKAKVQKLSKENSKSKENEKVYNHLSFWIKCYGCCYLQESVYHKLCLHFIT